MHAPRLYITMAAATLCLGTSLVWAQGGQDDGIGLFTAVQGAVSVAHQGAASPLPVNIHDEVLFKDIIETRNESRTKAFFNDDSILTVGENSRVEINEYLYAPDQNMRRTVVKLVQGTLRALVSKVFTESGSKFEIHTPSSVAAARGTYFVVWVENGVTGVVNIGNSGRVDFTSEGQTVTLDPGTYSVAVTGQAPAQPLVHGLGPSGGDSAVRAEKEKNPHASVLVSARNAIEDTVLRDTPKHEGARDALGAAGIPVLPTPVVSVTPAGYYFGNGPGGGGLPGLTGTAPGLSGGGPPGLSGGGPPGLSGSLVPAIISGAVSNSNGHGH